jgi:hypothetical protein
VARATDRKTPAPQTFIVVPAVLATVPRIGASALHRPRLTYANVASTLALVMASGGVAWAAGLPSNSVGSKQLRPSAVTTSKLASKSVTSTKLAPSSVSNAILAPASVSSAKLGAGSVSNDKIAVRAIHGDRLATDAVTAAQLAPDAVSPRNLAPNAVAPRNLSPETIAAYAPIAYSDANHTIQLVGSTSLIIGQLAVTQPGRYLMTFNIRAFPTAANPGHNLSCALNSPATSGGAGFTNAFVGDSTGVLIIPAQAIINVAAPATYDLTCRQISGAGQVTVTYDMSAVKVVVPPQ